MISAASAIIQLTETVRKLEYATDNDEVSVEVETGFEGTTNNFVLNGTMTITIKINGGAKIRIDD
jgi:hypothetical protein